MSFGKWLYDHRKERRYTQEVLASRANCTRAYISILERGSVDPTTGRPVQPSREIVSAIARALGVSLAEALSAAGYTAPEALPIPQEAELIETFRELPPEKQQDLIVIVRALLQDHRNRQADLANLGSE